jgi:hypothetical protein
VSDATIYRCTACDRQETRPTPRLGSTDSSARVAGWRISIGEPRVLVCPECADTDEGYWDRQTIAMAVQAGIDAGNTAWGVS